MTPRQRRAAAYHEAGHAVVGVALRLGILSAVVGDDLHMSRGRTHQRLVPRPRLLGQSLYTDERCLREIAGLYAGPVAEAREMTRRNVIGAFADFAEVRKLLLFQFSRTDWPTIERQQEARAITLVARHWNAIAEVAEVLVRTGRITGVEVRQAVGCRPERGVAKADGPSEWGLD